MTEGPRTPESLEAAMRELYPALNCLRTRGFHGRRNERGACVDCGALLPPGPPDSPILPNCPKDRTSDRINDQVTKTTNGHERLAAWLYEEYGPGFKWDQSSEAEREGWLEDADRILAALRSSQGTREREALQRIADGGCESFTSRGCYANGRRDDATYAADAPCWPCIARRALAGAESHAPAATEVPNG